MSSGIQFDEAWSRRVEAAYVTPDIVAQRQAVVNLLALRPGERVLDIGSGPGLLAQEMATRVGDGGAVSGVDVSESMIALAQRRCADLPWVDFRLGDASALPYAGGAFDVATATQVYNYIGDLPVALRELYRVLRPGGRALVLETDWDSLVWNTTDRERMRRVLTAWLEHSAHAYLPRTLRPLLRNARFEVTREAVFPLFNPRYAPRYLQLWANRLHCLVRSRTGGCVGGGGAGMGR